MGPASALIYTREKHIGFPGGWFKVQPEDFSDETSKSVMEYAMSAMEDVKPLRSIHKQVNIVIAENGYVVMGIAAYLRDLFSDGWEGIDEKNRPIYGFIGYVWKQNDFTQGYAFPKLNQFASLVAEHIRPNWELSKNSPWATYQERVPYRYSPCDMLSSADEGFVPDYIESVDRAEQLVQWAIQRAANGKTVSVCTNVTIYDAKDYKSPFRYVSQTVSSKKFIATGRTERTDSPDGTEKVGSADAKAETGGKRMLAANGLIETQRTSPPINSASKIIPVVLIALGVVLLILALISLPVAWMAGLLWKALLVIAIACLAVGIIKFVKVLQKSEVESACIPLEVPNTRQQTTRKTGTDVFHAATKIERSPVKPTTPKVKKPEEETTEDLFKF